MFEAHLPIQYRCMGLLDMMGAGRSTLLNMQVVCCTLTGALGRHLQGAAGKFDVVFVDEAAQVPATSLLPNAHRLVGVVTCFEAHVKNTPAIPAAARVRV